MVLQLATAGYVRMQLNRPRHCFRLLSLINAIVAKSLTNLELVRVDCSVFLYAVNPSQVEPFLSHDLFFFFFFNRISVEWNFTSQFFKIEFHS